MKKHLICLAMVAALSACGGTAHLTTPAAIASQAVGSADLAYIAASSAGSALASAGVISQDQFHALDSEAYAGLLSLRQTAAAVRAGALPPADLQTATANLNAALAALKAGHK